jgi:hypothetical protein
MRRDYASEIMRQRLCVKRLRDYASEIMRQTGVELLRLCVGDYASDGSGTFG